MTDLTTDLDVDAPEQVSAVLRKAAEAYRYSQGELQSAWQDKNAGKAWAKIARELEKLAAKLDKLDLS